MTTPDEGVQLPPGSFASSTSYMGYSMLSGEPDTDTGTSTMLLAGPSTLATGDSMTMEIDEDSELPPPDYQGNGEFFCDPLTSDYDGVILVHTGDVAARRLPDGWGTLYREDERGYVSRAVVRGGQSVNPRDGFILYDTEAPFNSPVHYVFKYKPASRITFYNYISNPSFEKNPDTGLTGTGLWRANTTTGRSLESVAGGAIPASESSGMIVRSSLPPTDLNAYSGRLLAHGDISMPSWKPLTSYRIGGWVKVQPNDVTTW